MCVTICMHPTLTAIRLPFLNSLFHSSPNTVNNSMTSALHCANMRGCVCMALLFKHRSRQHSEAFPAHTMGCKGTTMHYLLIFYGFQQLILHRLHAVFCHVVGFWTGFF